MNLKMRTNTNISNNKEAVLLYDPHCVYGKCIFIVMYSSTYCNLVDPITDMSLTESKSQILVQWNYLKIENGNRLRMSPD